MPKKDIPDRRAIFRVLGDALVALDAIDPSVRPNNAIGKPGGLVYLPASNYVVVVPDLHARVGFLRAVMRARLPMGFETVEQDMQRGDATVVCVGDAFHAEARARQRWKSAYREFVHGYERSPAMNEEMKESFDTLCEVARLQSTHPARFHFLKGNHENIANERGEGNFPFRKFVYEGDMVREWVIRMLGHDIFELVYRWEKALPLAAAGNRFLVTHAEPQQAFTPTQIVNAYLEPATIAALTWTDNGQAEEGSVSDTLAAFFGRSNKSVCFGGHRPVKNKFDLRQDGRYVQINTPNRWVVAAFRTVDEFDAERHVMDINALERINDGQNS